jgi:hypothetical protein
MADIIAQVRSRRVEGIDFSVEDVVRAYEIYGPDLQAVRGKSVKRKITKAQEPILHIDLMFLSGVSFLVENARPICMLMSNWIKGKGILSVKKALDSQKASLTSEGFEVVEISSDSERAIVALEDEIKEAGARVSIHGPNADSTHVDVKIKQLKNVTRAITVHPYLMPLSLLMYAVFYACAKMNMRSNSSLAHGYSPMEVFLERSVSVERDLEEKEGAGPMPFGSRCEIYDGATNTIADRTRPLGSMQCLRKWLFFYAGY